MQPTRNQSIRPAGRLRLVSNKNQAVLAELAVRRTCDTVQKYPQSLPLGAFRLCQHVNQGRLPYQDVWHRLKRAALSGGADEMWVDRVLYRSFADTMTNRIEPMPLNVLAGGLH